MTLREYLEKNNLDTYILNNLYEVDTWVLKFTNSLPKHIWNFYVYRKSYEFLLSENGVYNQIEITDEEFLKRYEQGENGSIGSTLNYVEFDNQFPMELIEDYYDFKHIAHHREKGLIYDLSKWIGEAAGDRLASIRFLETKNYFEGLLSHLTQLNETNSLNKIQKTVIDVHLHFYRHIIEYLLSKFDVLLINEKEIPTKENHITDTFNSKPKSPQWLIVATHLINSEFDYVKSKGEYIFENRAYNSASSLARKISDSLSLKTDSIKNTEAIRNVLSQSFPGYKPVSNNIFFPNHNEKLNNLLESIDQLKRKTGYNYFKKRISNDD